jgi:hypothetical protein
MWDPAKLYDELKPGFAKPVGTNPVRPVPGGTGPARYMNRSHFHPQTVAKILPISKLVGLIGLPAGFFE